MDLVAHISDAPATALSLWKIYQPNLQDPILEDYRGNGNFWCSVQSRTLTLNFNYQIFVN